MIIISFLLSELFLTALSSLESFSVVVANLPLRVSDSDSIIYFLISQFYIEAILIILKLSFKY